MFHIVLATTDEGMLALVSFLQHSESSFTFHISISSILISNIISFILKAQQMYVNKVMDFIKYSNGFHLMSNMAVHSKASSRV